LRKFKVASFDPSINSVGWAIFECDESIIDGGVIHLLPSERKLSVSERIKILVRQIAKILKFYRLGLGDYVVCESQPHIINPRNALILERVRGAIEGLSISLGLEVLGRINPRSLHAFLLGNKKQLKRNVVKNQIEAFVKWHFRDFFAKTVDMKRGCQDLYDAVALGYYFVKLLKSESKDSEFKTYLTDY
jgi:Holliday junction resolvasome RuvABC endonuclease subunit